MARSRARGRSHSQRPFSQPSGRRNMSGRRTRGRRPRCLPPAPERVWYTPLLLVRREPESLSIRVPCALPRPLPRADSPATVLATARFPERKWRTRRASQSRPAHVPGRGSTPRPRAPRAKIHHRGVRVRARGVGPQVDDRGRAGASRTRRAARPDARRLGRLLGARHAISVPSDDRRHDDDPRHSGQRPTDARLGDRRRLRTRVARPRVVWSRKSRPGGTLCVAVSDPEWHTQAPQTPSSAWSSSAGGCSRPSSTTTAGWWPGRACSRRPAASRTTTTPSAPTTLWGTGSSGYSTGSWTSRPPSSSCACPLCSAWRRRGSSVAGSWPERSPPRGGRAASPLWALTSGFVVGALAWGMTLRPEPMIALLATGVLACAVRFVERETATPIALSAVLVALALTAHPAGIVAFAPLVAILPRVARWARRRVVVAGSIAAASGAWLVFLAFVGSDVERRRSDAQTIRTYGNAAASWREEIERYADLFTIYYGAPLRRESVALMLLAVLAYVVRSRRERRVPLDVPALALGLGLLLLVATPSKWPWHFGTLIGIAAIAVAVETARLGEEARRARGWSARPFLVIGAAVVAAAWSWSPRHLWSDLDLRTLGWTLGFETSLVNLAKLAGAIPLALLAALGAAELIRGNGRRLPEVPWRVARWMAPVLAVPLVAFTVGVLVTDAVRTSSWTLARQNLDTLAGGSGCGLADDALVAQLSSARALPEPRGDAPVAACRVDSGGSGRRPATPVPRAAGPRIGCTLVVVRHPRRARLRAVSRKHARRNRYTRARVGQGCCRNGEEPGPQRDLVGPGARGPVEPRVLAVLPGRRAPAAGSAGERRSSRPAEPGSLRNGARRNRSGDLHERDADGPSRRGRLALARAPESAHLCSLRRAARTSWRSGRSARADRRAPGLPLALARWRHQPVRGRRRSLSTRAPLALGLTRFPPGTSCSTRWTGGYPARRSWRRTRRPSSPRKRQRGSHRLRARQRDRRCRRPPRD